MSQNLSNLLYRVTIVCFVLALRFLSSPTTARRGNWIGAAGMAAGAGLVFALGLVGFAAHLAWQIVRLDIADPDRCLALFKSDRDAGLILFAGLLLDAALPRLA